METEINKKIVKDLDRGKNSETERGQSRAASRGIPNLRQEV